MSNFFVYKIIIYINKKIKATALESTCVYVSEHVSKSN